MPAKVDITFEGHPEPLQKAIEAVEAAIAGLPRDVKAATASVNEDFAVSFKNLQFTQSGATETTKEFSLAMINLRDAGAAFTIIARQMKAAIDESLNAFIDFDKVIQQTATLATDSGAKISATMRDEITKSVREMAVEFNIDVNQMALTLRELVAQGFSAEEALTILRAGAEASVSGLGDMQASAKLVATTIRSFGLNTEDAGKVAAIFTFIGQKTNLTMDEMATAMQFAGAQAGQMGFSLEETVSILGLMRNAGLEASIAGTTLRQFLVRIQDPTSQARALLDDLGISLTDASGNFLSMAQILGNVDMATKDMTQAQRAQVIATLFETRGQAAFNLTMAQGLSTLTNLTDEARVFENAQTAQTFLGEQTNKMLDSQAVAYQQVQKELQITHQIMGEKLIPTQTNFLKVSNALLRAFVDMPFGIGNVNAALYSVGQTALNSSGQFFFLITSLQTAGKSLGKTLPTFAAGIKHIFGIGVAAEDMTVKMKAARGAVIGLGLAYVGLLAYTAALNAKTNEERALYSVLTGLTWGLAAAQMAYALAKQLSVPVVGIGLAIGAGAAFITYLAASKASIENAKNAAMGAIVLARPGSGELYRVGEGVNNEIISPEPMMRRIVKEEVAGVLARASNVTNQDTFIFNIPPFHQVDEPQVRRWARIVEDTKRRTARTVMG